MKNIKLGILVVYYTRRVSIGMNTGGHWISERKQSGCHFQSLAQKFFWDMAYHGKLISALNTVVYDFF